MLLLLKILLQLPLTLSAPQTKMHVKSESDGTLFKLFLESDF